VEEEEDEELERERNNGLLSPGVIGGGIYGVGGAYGEVGFKSARMRTQTSSTVESLTGASGGGVGPSTAAYAASELSLGGTSGIIAPGIGTNGAALTPTTPTPLTPVVALPTGDLEAQVGLAKVAEPDLDAFMTYAAIVPEYCRLEGMVIKGIV